MNLPLEFFHFFMFAVDTFSFDIEGHRKGRKFIWTIFQVDPTQPMVAFMN